MIIESDTADSQTSFVTKEETPGKKSGRRRMGQADILSILSGRNSPINLDGIFPALTGRGRSRYRMSRRRRLSYFQSPLDESSIV